MKNHIFKRGLALFLALVCVMGILPLNAFAADATPPASITQISSDYVTINGKYVRYRAASSAINSIGLPNVFNEQVNIPGYGSGRALCAYQLGDLDHGLELSDCQHDHRQRGWHHHSGLTRCCNTFPFKYYDIV